MSVLLILYAMGGRVVGKCETPPESSGVDEFAARKVDEMTVWFEALQRLWAEHVT